MYKLGTLKQFTLEDTAAKKAAGWDSAEIKNGKIATYKDGEEVFEYTTINLIPKEQNPDGSDEYLWESVNGDIKDPFNIKSSWSKQIKGHDSIKYYIALKSICNISDSGESGCYLYGKTEVGQVVSFGINVADIHILDSEKEYLARASELGVEIDDLES